jgi:hypothetical protein
MNTFVRDNIMAGGPIYATEADRTTGIPSPFEGQRAYITGSTETTATGATSGTAQVPTGIQTIYNGSGWVTVTPVGASAAGGSNALTTSYANLTVGGVSTTVTLRTGTTALVSFGGRNLASTNFYSLAVAVTSTPTVGPNAASILTNNAALITCGRTFVMTGLTAGLNTFAIQGTANVAGGTYDLMTLAVQGIA